MEGLAGPLCQRLVLPNDESVTVSILDDSAKYRWGCYEEQLSGLCVRWVWQSRGKRELTSADDYGAELARQSTLIIWQLVEKFTEHFY